MNLYQYRANALQPVPWVGEELCFSSFDVKLQKIATLIPNLTEKILDRIGGKRSLIIRFGSLAAKAPSKITGIGDA